MALTIATGQQELPQVDSSGAVVNPAAAAVLSTITYNGTSRVMKIIATISTTAAGTFVINIGAKSIAILAPIGVTQVVIVWWLQSTNVLGITVSAAIIGTVSGALNIYMAAPGNASGWAA